jgi:Tfp pilus assembly protein PilP
MPRAIAIAVLLCCGRALAQMPTDAAAAVAVMGEQERAAANQARGSTNSMVQRVFGGTQAAPNAAAPAAAANGDAPPANDAAAEAAPADGAPAGGVPPIAAIPPGAVNSATTVLPNDAVPVIDGVPNDGTAQGAEQQAIEAAAALVQRGRDPFRPFTLDLRTETHESEILTPLQRYELPQLRLAGVVLELSPPRAMLQDNSGMGYIVTPGTPIGRRRGVVKAIESRRVVVEEHVIDYYGREQTHQVVIEMARDDRPQSTIQE